MLQVHQGPGVNQDWRRAQEEAQHLQRPPHMPGTPALVQLERRREQLRVEKHMPCHRGRPRFVPRTVLRASPVFPVPTLAQTLRGRAIPIL